MSPARARTDPAPVLKGFCTNSERETGSAPCTGPESAMNTKKSERRRIKLIKPGLQLRLTGVFLGLSGLGFMLQALHVGLRLSEVSGHLPHDGTFLMSMLPELPIEILLFSFGMLMPLTLAVGVLITFRIAGPIYRFEQFLQAVKTGKQVGPCKLRTGDELQELCQLINSALAKARTGEQTEVVELGSEPEPEERDAAA